MTTSEAAQPQTGDFSQAPSGSFDDLDIPADMRAGLKALGYAAPTPVQRQAYPLAREGKDLVCQSKTGTGKTTAFCLPIGVGLKTGMDRPQALVLCPTRELANQVAAEASKLFAPKGLEVVAIYGGADFKPQLAALQRGAALVVGTPGRIQDQIERGNLKLDAIRYAVLDEADEMLDAGFWEDVTRIIRMLPQERQTFLFSATMPEPIERAAKQFMKEPVRLHISGDVYSVEGIENFYYTWDDTIPKPRMFLWLMEVERPRSAIVFSNTRVESEMLCHYLRRFGIPAEVLNGDLAQNERERVMRRVKSGELQVMVATDLAARGIDISDLSHVFNYDLPEDPEIYIHRVGRTGRIGKRGTAVSLVRGRFEATLDILKKKFNVPLVQRTLPPEAEVIRMQSDRIGSQLREDARGVEFNQYKPVAEEILKAGDANELMAFLLRSYFSARRGRSEEAAAAGAPAGGHAHEHDHGHAGHDRPPRDRPPREARERRPPREDRPPREERQPRAEGAPADAAPPETPVDLGPPTALFIGLGRKQGVTEEALKAWVAEKGGLPADQVGRISIRFDFSVVDVPPEQVTGLVTKLHEQPLGEHQARVEPKRKTARSAEGGGHDHDHAHERAAGEGGDDRPRRRRRRGGRGRGHGGEGQAPHEGGGGGGGGEGGGGAPPAGGTAG